MSNRLRLKRRVSGNAGAPATLLNGEVAYNEVSDQLWYGKGLGQDGNATSVICIGGEGTYATKSHVSAAVAAVDVSSQLANYLTTATAASTYLSQATAASTYATQSYVATQISDVIGAAPTALNTLKELADALGSDASFSATVTTSLGTKADRTLSNLTDASAARTNLGLGSIATQTASNVAITGGSIDNITIDSGTF